MAGPGQVYLQVHSNIFKLRHRQARHIVRMLHDEAPLCDINQVWEIDASESRKPRGSFIHSGVAETPKPVALDGSGPNLDKARDH